MKIILILALSLLSYNSYSEEIKYTKSGIPIKFVGLYDVSYDTDGMDTNSLIYIIMEKEKQRWRNSYK